MAYHGFPRFTKDIDIFYANTRDNAARLQAALATFGFQLAGVPLEAIESAWQQPSWRCFRTG